MPLNTKQRYSQQKREKNFRLLLANLPQAHIPISFEDAVLLLAERVHIQSDRPSDTRKKVRQRINRAIKSGELMLDQNGSFIFGMMVNWARSKPAWEPKLQDLPAIVLGVGDVELPMYQMNDGYSYALPSTTLECHDALHNAHARIVQLIQENMRLQKLAGIG